jgi:hypothetical protein
LLLSGRIDGLLPYSSIFQDAQTRRLGAVPIKGQAMTRYLAKSRNEANSVARETLEKATIGEMRRLAKRIGMREPQATALGGELSGGVGYPALAAPGLRASPASSNRPFLGACGALHRIDTLRYQRRPRRQDQKAA